jgi:hypothetical protein
MLFGSIWNLDFIQKKICKFMINMDTLDGLEQQIQLNSNKIGLQMCSYSGANPFERMGELWLPQNFYFY